MKSRLNFLRAIYFILALLVASVTFVILKSNKTKSSSAKIVVQKETEFSTSNYSTIQIDTFIHLLKSTYKDFASINRENKLLQITINGTNQHAYSFYNGNAALLKFKRSDYGFEINLNEQTKNIDASFEIKDDGVNIPNDVMINLTKLYSDIKP